jgi:hypothetical protein
MTTNGDRPSTSASQTRRLGGKNSTKYSFRIQSAPPLSLQQFLRSATGVIVGTQQWRPSGIYRPPPFRSYVPPTVREKKKPTEPVWHPPSAYREKPPTSLSPEKVKPKHISEPVWHPAGKVKPEHVPYFDPPSLRWSLQELLRSMPEMRPQTFRASRSTSILRKSEEGQSTSRKSEDGQSTLKKHEGQGTLRESAEVQGT